MCGNLDTALISADGGISLGVLVRLYYVSSSVSSNGTDSVGFQNCGRVFRASFTFAVVLPCTRSTMVLRRRAQHLVCDYYGVLTSPHADEVLCFPPQLGSYSDRPLQNAGSVCDHIVKVDFLIQAQACSAA